MHKKIAAYAITPVIVPLALVQLHYAGKPSKPTRAERKRQKEIAKIQNARYNR